MKINFIKKVLQAGFIMGLAIAAGPANTAQSGAAGEAQTAPMSQEEQEKQARMEKFNSTLEKIKRSKTEVITGADNSGRDKSKVVFSPE